MNGNTSPEHQKSLQLSDLIDKLNTFSEAHSTPYTINRCKLDTVFEKILESSDNDGGYVHRGFVDTET